MVQYTWLRLTILLWINLICMDIVSSCHFISKLILIFKSVLHNICQQHAKEIVLFHSKHSPYFCYNVWCCQWCRNCTQQLEVLWRYLWNSVYVYTEMYICNNIILSHFINYCNFIYSFILLMLHWEWISVNVFPFFLWKVRAYQMLSMANKTANNVEMNRVEWQSGQRSSTHRFDTLKLLPLLYLLQLCNILQRRLLKVLPHHFHRHVCLKTDSMNKVL